MANKKKLTNKELESAIMLNRQAMVNIDNYVRASIKEIVQVLTSYIDFKKDRTKFEKHMASLIEKAKKLAEEQAKSQQNKEVTAKEESQVPNK